MESLFEAFKRNRDTRPDSAAFLIAAGDRSVPIAWRKFARDVEVIGRLVARHAPGATIGLLGENSYEWITAFTAGIFAGVRVVPLETTLEAAEVAERLVFTGARVLVHSALYVEKARAVGELLPQLIVAGFGSREADKYMAFAEAELDLGESGLFDLPPRDEDETAVILFTSGTTSKPRGAELTLRALATFAAFASERLPMKDGARSLMLLPLHHVYGLAMTCQMIAHGVALGVCPDFRRLYDAVERFHADFLCLVPALADILAAKIERRGAARAAHLDWILSGGAPLARRTQERLAALGLKVLQIYGLTETCALYAMSPYEDPRPGSVGLACGGFAGMETRVTEDGVLAIRGPSVMKDYFGDPERTAAAKDAAGWFLTGDLGRIDADGYVWITGRASRTIVLSSGKKVAPEELEERILSLSGVREVVVRGDGETRELTAEVFAEVPEEAVRAHLDALNRLLPVHKRIRALVMRREPFPRTASGKIRVEAATAPSAPPRAETPPPPEGAARDAAAFWRAYRLPIVAALAVVITANVVQFLLLRAGIVLPDSVKIFEEGGEIALALLVLLAVLGVRHRSRKAR